MTKIFFPKEATIKIDASADVTVSASTVLDTAFAASTAMTGQFKDISITMPVGTVTKVDIMGTTSSFQNAELQEDPAGLCEVSGTLVLPGDEIMEAEIFGSGTAAGGTHTTYQTGKATRTKLAVMLNVDDGTDEVNFAIINARLTEWTTKMGSDDHQEITVKFECLPKDAFGPQFKD